MSLEITKLNHISGSQSAKFLGLDLNGFYLNTPMDRPEFLRIKVENFPGDVINQYKLKDIVDAKGLS